MTVEEIRSKFPINIVEFWEKNLRDGEQITYTINHYLDDRKGIAVYVYKFEFGTKIGKYLAFINKDNSIEYYWNENWISAKEMETCMNLKVFGKN